ncbi:unnamed protein product, partial [Symbiodinium pilosum]
ETATMALDLLKQVMESMKAGKRPPKLPEEWVELSESEDAATQVLEQSSRHWDLMKAQAAIAVKNNHWTKRVSPL